MGTVPKIIFMWTGVNDCCAEVSAQCGKRHRHRARHEDLILLQHWELAKCRINIAESILLILWNGTFPSNSFIKCSWFSAILAGNDVLQYMKSTSECICTLDMRLSFKCSSMNNRFYRFHEINTSTNSDAVLHLSLQHTYQRTLHYCSFVCPF